MRARFIAIFLGALFLLSSPVQAFPVHAENLGLIHPRPEEKLYLIKILAEGFLADKIYYAAADNQGNLVALTSAVGRYTHKLECTPHEGCLIYNLWGAEKKIWDFKTGLPLQERKPLFGKEPNGEKTEYHQAWGNFINKGKGGRIEALFLQDMLRQPFGIFHTDTAKHVQKNFFVACILTLLMLAAFYSAAQARRSKSLFLEAASYIGYGLSFIFACAIADMALTIPPLHFFAIMLASILYFYRLHNRARRLAS